MAQDDLTLDVRLSQLIDRWHALRAAGATLTVAQLCSDCPELADALREHIDRLQQEAAAADSIITAFDSTLPRVSRSAPPWPGIPGYEPLNGGRRGGMGAVYQARHLGLDRIVAVKVLSAGRFASARELQQFVAESRLPARLEHPHIVRVYDFNHFQEQPYIVMEWVDGGNLSEHMKRAGRGPLAAAALMEKIARAVHFLHQNKVWHRDLKPSNILIDRSGEPKICDFGLARQISEDPEETRSLRASGTPPYMAPELFGESGRPTVQTDIWALGVTFFEMLTGRRPFNDRGSRSLISSIRSGQPPQMHKLRPKLDRSLDVIVRRCLEKDPRDRYPTAEALAEDLRKWQQGQTIRERPWLRRNWRKIQRQSARLLYLAAALPLWALAIWLGSITLTKAPAPQTRDPDLELRAMEQEWREGRRVTIIDSNGSPRWWKWKIGKQNGAAYTTKANLFEVTCRELAAIELAEEIPLDGFRIEATIRQEEGGDIAQAGLYFGHQYFGGQGASLDAFFEYSFVDVGLQVDIVSQRQKERSGLLEAQARIYHNPNPAAAAFNMFSTYPHFRKPNRSPEGVARELAVDVTDKTLTFWLDGVLVGKHMDIVDFRKDVQLLVDRCQNTVPCQPTWDFRKNLGIFVINCSATFRDVRIGPIPE